MKQFLGVGALAVALVGVPTQQASAWTNLSFSAGVNFNWQSGGHRVLWGAYQSAMPDGSYIPGRCQNGQCAPGLASAHGGHGGAGHQQSMYYFPGPYQPYPGHPHVGHPHPGHPHPGHPHQPFPPPPQRENKDGRGKQEETVYPNYTYPNLGYSVYQPTSYYGYQNFYHTPTFRFDE